MIRKTARLWTRQWMLVLCGLSCAAIVAAHDTPRLNYSIESTHAHDVSRFTQGLSIHEGQLIESAGGFGRSTLSISRLEKIGAGIVRPIPAKYFAEGVSASPVGIVMLSWRAGLAFVFDEQLEPVRQHAYNGEGWGLTFDGHRFVMSDGSSRLQFRDAERFTVQDSIVVRDHDRQISSLNELEYAYGRVFANVWHRDEVAVIDPADGQVHAWLDLSALRQGFRKPLGWNPAEHVLNGIAYDEASDRFWVTGKCWPVMYVIKVHGLPPPDGHPKEDLR